jgi:hypothetical protein
MRDSSLVDVDRLARFVDAVSIGKRGALHNLGRAGPGVDFAAGKGENS